MASTRLLTIALALAFASSPLFAANAEPVGRETAASAVDLHGDSLPPRAALRLGTTRLHHQSSPHATAFSPDGRLLASAASNQDTSVVIWEVPSGRLVRRFVMAPVDNQWPWTESLAFSRDGQRLATGDMRGNVHLWNVADGAELYSIAAYTKYPGATAIAFSGDGSWLATGGGDGAVRVWSVKGGHELLSFDTLPPQKHDFMANAYRGKFPMGSIAALTFSPDGRHLAAGVVERTFGDKSGKIRIWDLHTNRPVHSIDSSNGLLTSLAYTPDGNQLISGGCFNTGRNQYGKPYHMLTVNVPLLRVWDAGTGTMLREIVSAAKEPGYGAFASSRDGRTLAAGYEDKILIWDFASGKVKRSIDVPQWWGKRGLALSRDGRVVCAPLNNAIGLWDTETGESIGPKADSHTSYVNSVAYASGGDFIVTTGDETVRVWDAAAGRQRWAQTMGAHGGAAALALSPDDSLIAVGGPTDHGEGGVRIWQAATGEQVRFIPMFEKRFYVRHVRALAFAADGKLLAIARGRPKASNIDDVDVFEVASGVKRAEMATGSFTQSYALAFSHDAGTLCTLGRDAIIGVWDTATGKQRRQFTALKPPPEVPGGKSQKPWIASGVFSSDAKTLITSQGVELVLWDIDRGEPIASIPSQGTDKGGNLALSRDGRWLAMSDLLYAGDPGADAIRRFDLREKRLVSTFETTHGRPSSFAFSPDAARLVTGMSDGTALVWDVSDRTSK